MAGGKKPAGKEKKAAEKKKKAPTQLWTLYEVNGTGLVRKRKFSPKSPGDFMAQHKNRTVCGKTGYVEYKKKERKESEKKEKEMIITI